jgi:hypothetical protein
MLQFIDSGKNRIIDNALLGIIFPLQQRYIRYFLYNSKPFADGRDER